MLLVTHITVGFFRYGLCFMLLLDHAFGGLEQSCCEKQNVQERIY